MRRFTPTDLKLEVKAANQVLAESGSNIFYKEGYHYEWQKVDLYFIEEDGSKTCQCNLESGTSRECDARMNLDLHTTKGKMHYPTKPTRKMAKGVLSMHIDFSKDVHCLKQSDCEMLRTWAKITKYAKPANASRGFGFFIHLQKRVSI
jgi:hypothetical protein